MSGWFFLENSRQVARSFFRISILEPHHRLLFCKQQGNVWSLFWAEPTSFGRDWGLPEPNPVGIIMFLQHTFLVLIWYQKSRETVIDNCETPVSVKHTVPEWSPHIGAHISNCYMVKLLCLNQPISANIKYLFSPACFNRNTGSLWLWKACDTMAPNTELKTPPLSEMSLFWSLARV